MGARNQVGIGYCYRARQATHPGGTGFLESILGLHKSLKIQALEVGRFRDPLQWASLTRINFKLSLF
jgi:hypothetical protein